MFNNQYNSVINRSNPGVEPNPNRGPLRNENGFYAVEDKEYLRDVFRWLGFSFLAATIGTLLIGPLIPVGLIPVLSIGMIVFLIAVSLFARGLGTVGSGLMAIIVPTVLGIVLSNTLAYYIAVSPAVVVYAVMGTAVSFSSAAFMAFRSERNLNVKIMFSILMGLIIISLLNFFVFKIGLLSFIVSCVSVVLFTLYSFHDIQQIRRGGRGILPAQAALSVFLDIYNLFVSFLNIFGRFSR